MNFSTKKLFSYEKVDNRSKAARTAIDSFAPRRPVPPSGHVRGVAAPRRPADFKRRASAL